MKWRLKKIAGIDVKENVEFADIEVNADNYESLVGKSTFIEEAQNSSTDIDNAIDALETKQLEYDLLQEYLDLDEYQKDIVDAEKSIIVLTSDLERLKNSVESNVDYALNDILFQRVNLIEKRTTLDYNEMQYKNAIKTYEQGLIKDTDVDMAEVAWINSKIDLYNAERALEHGYLKFDALRNYGVKYE